MKETGDLASASPTLSAPMRSKKENTFHGPWKDTTYWNVSKVRTEWTGKKYTGKNHDSKSICYEIRSATCLFSFFFFDVSPPFFDVPISRAQLIEEVLSMQKKGGKVCFQSPDVHPFLHELMFFLAPTNPRLNARWIPMRLFFFPSG